MKRATLFSLALGLSTLASPARTKISDRDAVRAIIGLTNPVVDTASDALWARDRRAWATAKSVDAAAGCKFFGCPTDVPWFHKHGFTAVKTIGQITFYKP